MRKTIIKTLTWRVIALTITFLVCYYFTGHIINSMNMAIVLNLIKTGAYFAHEILWEKY